MSETTIEAVPDLPVIRITREFDAPAEKVFRAHTERDLFAQWVGPRSIDTTITAWDARTGGRWAYRATRDEDGLDTGFFGSFHEVRPPERIVQTFTWEGAPDGVSLETVTFEDLPGGRCRIVGTSVVETIEIRDLMLSSGMEVGVNEGYEQLDAILAGASMTPAEHHRAVAALFTERVEGTTDWDAPTPVDGWAARDVVEHLTTWLPAFLESRGLPGLDTLAGARYSTDEGGGSGGRGSTDERGGSGGGSSAGTDPVAAWRAQADGVQALLEGPEADLAFEDPYLGPQRLGELVDRIYTGDVFLHTWDLARATGQDDTLDPATCAAMLAGMEPIEDLIRSSGQYGARVEVPPDADVQTRLLGFIGRDPGWRAP